MIMRRNRAPMRLIVFRVVAWCVLGILSAIMLIGGTQLLASLIGSLFR